MSKTNNQLSDLTAGQHATIPDPPVVGGDDPVQSPPPELPKKTYAFSGPNRGGVWDQANKRFLVRFSGGITETTDSETAELLRKKGYKEIKPS